MPEFDITKKSRPVVITPYQPRWADEFARAAARVRGLVGDAALRVDHVGSTAVTGLGGKDVIDSQVAVAGRGAGGALAAPLKAAGFRRGEAFEYDLFRAKPEADPELRKLYLRE